DARDYLLGRCEETDELLAVQEYEIAGGFVKLGPVRGHEVPKSAVVAAY
ncbi:hypothetical protein F443_22929, partial [Phytophthora nicotianae P1569]